MERISVQEKKTYVSISVEADASKLPSIPKDYFPVLVAPCGFVCGLSIAVPWGSFNKIKGISIVVVMNTLTPFHFPKRRT